MIFENSSDVIALVTCVGTVAVSVIAAVRYSRCVRIKCCCMECDRKVNSKPESPRESRETREEAAVQV
jgi:hypothetical protein